MKTIVLSALKVNSIQDIFFLWKVSTYFADFVKLARRFWVSVGLTTYLHHQSTTHYLVYFNFRLFMSIK